LDGEKFNRQLHQKEIAFLENAENIEAFAEYYQNYTGEELSIEDAGKMLAQGGASLVDKSWNDKVGDDSGVKEAQDFIKENYTDKSAIFYDDEEGMRVGTHGFDANKDEYKDRYANMQGFTENKDFYQQNLNVGNGNGASTGDYVNGALKPIKELGTALQNDPLATLGAMGEGIVDAVLNPLDTLHETGVDAGALEDKAQLDTMLGDDTSAAQHRGEAYGGVVAAVVGGAVVKGTTKGLNALDGAVDGIETPDLSSVIGQGEAGKAIDADPWNIGSTDKDFYINSEGTLIYPSTGYRVLAEESFERAKNGEGVMSSGDTYMTFDNPGDFTSNVEAGNAVQVPYDPAGYVKFDTAQVGDDIHVPKEDWNRGKNPEPYAEYFGPNHPEGENYGLGEASQAITNTEIKNYETETFTNE